MIGGLKKSIRIILIILMVTGVCYAEGTYRKTAMEPWIYKAMSFLKQKGLIADYPAAWVDSGNQLSRFEVAYYIKGLITNQSAVPDLPDSEVEILRKLIAEFQMELTDLGVQITDIDQIHPNLTKILPEASEYQDLDNIISMTKVEVRQPCYYLGQYFSKQRKKSFIFIPMEYARSNYAFLLNGDESSFNIYYQPLGKNPILVVKSNLPLNNLQSVSGYYLFPIELKSDYSLGSSHDILNINDKVLPLLDEVNQIQWIDRLWSVNGILPLNGYLPEETDLKTKAFVGNLNQGLKIGDLLVYSEDFNDQKSLRNANLTVPLSNSTGGVGNINSFNVPIDLDAIEGTNLQPLQLNIEYPMVVPPETALKGIDLSYQGVDLDNNNKGPANSKANAGINYHFNDYWTFIAYQSLDNSKLQVGWLTTTSLGINYNDWVTLWLAYRLVDFDKPVVSGSLALHF